MLGPRTQVTAYSLMHGLCLVLCPGYVPVFTRDGLMGLREHIEWWRGYYHFIRPHESLREELSQPRERGEQRIPQRYRQRTPAMAAGITGHRWSVREFLSFPLVAGAA